MTTPTGPEDQTLVDAFRQKRTELVVEAESKLLARVESLVEWLRSTPGLSAEEQDWLRNVAAEWGEQVGRTEQLRRHAFRFAASVPSGPVTDPASTARIFEVLSARAERMAFSARIAGAVVTARAEIERRLAEHEPESA